MYRVPKNLINDLQAFRNALRRIFPNGFEEQWFSPRLGETAENNNQKDVTVSGQSNSPQTFDLTKLLQDEGVILKEAATG